MRVHRPVMYVVPALMLWLAAASAGAQALPGCASPAEVAQVQALYAEAERAPLPMLAATRLGLAEAVVISALVPDWAVGTDASLFRPVWDSLADWGPVVTLIARGGNIFEVHGPVPGGEPSKISQYFNLDDGHALGGHLRPDLLRGIYALELAGEPNPIRGVIFYAADGTGLFGVYLPAEGETPSAEAVAAFRRTRDLVAAGRPLCLAAGN